MTRFFDEDKFKKLEDNSVKHPIDFVVDMRDEFAELCTKYKLPLKMSFTFSENNKLNLFVGSAKLFTIVDPYESDPTVIYSEVGRTSTKFDQQLILSYMNSEYVMNVLQFLLGGND